MFLELLLLMLQFILKLDLPCDYPGFIHIMQQPSDNSFIFINTHDSSDHMDTIIDNINIINSVFVSLEQSDSLNVYSTQHA